MENDWKPTPEEREEINRLMQEAIEGLESLSAKVE